MSKPHKHAALMAQYAQDAWVSDKPWELWESRKCGATEWNFLHVSPVWYDDFEYRRKPQMVRRTIEYPEPCREPLENGQEYWPMYLEIRCHAWKWSGDSIDYRLLKEGRVHLTKESAEAHRQALRVLRP